LDSIPKTSLTLLHRLQKAETDENAWVEFVDRYGPQMHRWCRKWIRQDADAEEIVQNVMLTLARKFREFQYDSSRGRLRGWLRTLVFNAWYDFAAGKKAAGIGSGDSQVIHVLLNQVEARDDLIQRLEQEFDLELYEIARERIQSSVPPRTWEAYSLTAEEHLTPSEAASKLNVTVATVYSCKSEVLSRFKEEIDRLERAAPH
jgi:RNA polymerase sigma factor (sigma-70 family)